MRTLRAIALGFSAALCAGASCQAEVETEPPPGELMVAVQTDMSLPKDVDKVRIEVLSFGSLQFGNDYDVGPSGLKIPATIGIVAGEDPSKPVTIRVIARQAGKARMLREVVTTVPADRLATLRIPIQWLCDGNAEETSPGQVEEGKCPDQQTCVAGSCTSWEVDSAALPDYSPADIFGGGSGTGDGTCFDTVACLKSGTVVVPDAACTIAAPADLGKTNVGLQMAAGGDGICDESDTTCFIPLDGASDVGWSEGRGEAQGRIQLVPAVCERLASGTALGLVVSDRCATKTPSVPTCGPWSSVVPQTGENVCGDGLCQAGESCESCAADCGDCTGECVDCEGGSCNGNVCTIATGSGGAQQMLLGPDAAYWLDGDAHAILTGSLTGSSEPTTFYAAPTGATITSFALGSVYWTEATELWFNSLTDGTDTSITTGSNLRGLTRDQSKGYFVRDDCDGGTPCFSSSIACFYLGELGTPYVLASNQPSPHRLLSDGQHLFWLNGGDATGSGGAVMSRDIFGTMPPVVNEGNLPSPRDLDVDATRIYYATGTGEVRSVPIGGGSPVSLSTEPPADDIALAGAYVYFASAASQSISRVSIQGGSVETVAQTGGTPTSLVSDGTAIFWATAEGAIKKVTPQSSVEPPDAGTGEGGGGDCAGYYGPLTAVLGVACGECMVSSCCAAGLACLADPACATFSQCWLECAGDPSCEYACTEQTGGVPPDAFSAVMACKQGQCGAACSSGTLDGGTDGGSQGGVCHDKCVAGPYMSPTCELCVEQICAQDSYCCQTSWDSTCVNEVSSICGITCVDAGADAGAPGGDAGECLTCEQQFYSPDMAVAFCTPSAEAAFSTLMGCACGACATPCMPNVCEGFLPPDTACTTCVQTACVDQFNACKAAGLP